MWEFLDISRENIKLQIPYLHWPPWHRWHLRCSHMVTWYEPHAFLWKLYFWCIIVFVAANQLHYYFSDRVTILVNDCTTKSVLPKCNQQCNTLTNQINIWFYWHCQLSIFCMTIFMSCGAGTYIVHTFQVWDLDGLMSLYLSVEIKLKKGTSFFLFGNVLELSVYLLCYHSFHQCKGCICQDQAPDAKVPRIRNRRKLVVYIRSLEAGFTLYWAGYCIYRYDHTYFRV